MPTLSLSARERVLACLAHQEPDRTPCDFWAEPAALNRLYAHIGHRDEERLLRDLGIDMRRIDAVGPPEQPVDRGLFRNMWGEQYVYRTTPWGPVREDAPGALATATSLAEIEAFPWPTNDVFSYDHIAGQCELFGDYAILYGFADIWERPALVRGWEQLFLDMAERPDWAHFLCRRFTDFYLEDYTRAQESARGRIDLFLLISDLGTQRGPLMSRAMFQQFVAPYIREMVERIHELGGKAMYHTCGMVESFIPDLIALGVDVLDPIQPIGDAMSPEHLKAEFGADLCFHGGIDTQVLLPFGTPEQVTAEARRYCETLGHGGGYILAPSHLFQPDVPPENIVAVYAG